MKSFKIAVQWTMTGEVEVQADNMKDAIEKAYDTEGLPQGEYLDDSFTVVKELCKVES